PPPLGSFPPLSPRPPAPQGAGGAPTPPAGDLVGPRTLLLATHDLNLAAVLAARVVALANGRVAADGPADEVLAPERLEELYGAPFRAAGVGPERRLWIEL